jgi:hypothetical protein
MSALVERFNPFFVSKITIRATLNAVTSSWMTEAHRPVAAFSTFSAVNVHDISSLISSCPSKSSPLDPIPTFVLKVFFPVLAPSITSIMNLSLSSGIFPHEMKLAVITILLKKRL